MRLSTCNSNNQHIPLYITINGFSYDKDVQHYLMSLEGANAIQHFSSLTYNIKGKKMTLENKLLLKLSESCVVIKSLLDNRNGNLYKLIKNKKNKFAKVELQQLYERFNNFLSIVDQLNKDCDFGYTPDEEYIKKKIWAKNLHLEECYVEYKNSMDSNLLWRLKEFWCGGINLKVGIFVINNDIAFTCSKIHYDILRILDYGWDEKRHHKLHFNSNNKKLLMYRINKLTALLKIQNNVYNENLYPINSLVCSNEEQQRSTYWREGSHMRYHPNSP